MKMRRNCVRILACVGLCLGFMGTGLAAEGMDFRWFMNRKKILEILKSLHP